MKMKLEAGLLYVGVSIRTGDGVEATLDNVIVDTGSASTVFAARRMQEIGVEATAEDIVYNVRGVGGTEPVFQRQVASLSVGAMTTSGFSVEVAAMEYGFPLDGILGLDFLLTVGAHIDLNRLELYGAASNE